jgi:hypothetical protein
MHFVLPTPVRAIAGHRITHFLVIGLALFALAPRQPSGRDIDIPRGALDALHSAEAHRLGLAALPAAKVREVDERAVEDEILYREALRLGLDKDDPIVRQRLVQKMLLLAEDMGGASRPPTESELRACFDAAAEVQRRPAALHFIQVFATTEQRALSLGERLQATDDVPPPIGEPFPYPRDAHLDEDEIASLYGASFAGALHELPLGAWSGPLRSSFGWHRVRVLERLDGGPARFEDVRGKLALECAMDRRQKVVTGFLQQTFARYHVALGGQRVTHLNPARRVAPRAESSAED